MPQYHQLKARFSGRCTCGAKVSVGASVMWEATTRRITKCSWCRPMPKRTPVVRIGSLLTPFEHLSDPLGETYPSGINGPRNPWR